MSVSRPEAISAFHRWFRDARPRLSTAVEAQDLEPLVEEISQRVHTLFDGLGWEIGPGVRGARHAFALSPGQDLAARRVAELWRAAGPRDDEQWELHAAKPGGGDLDALALQVEGETVAFGEMHVEGDIDDQRERVDVRVFHPAFARIAPALAQQLAELAVVETLGEDGCARWLGELEAVRASPAAVKEARPLAALREATAALEKSATRERFAVLRGEADGKPAFALVNLACKPIDHLAFDVYLRIEIDAADVTDDGLPNEDELQALDAIEEDLLGGLEGHAAFFAHETGAGKRVIHFFTDGDKPARAAVEEWCKVHGEDRAIVAKWTPDPAWKAIARFG
jgi:hypothetical protein